MLNKKRIFDFLVSLFLLFAFAPIMAIVALLIRKKLGTPVLFKQQRPGLDGKPFTILKFRTMLDAEDENGNQLPDAERLTKFGKFLRASSLDELPELINVLKGDMSLVGPRPLLMEYLELYSAKQARRHDVRPGITGWAQINGRNAISWQEKFELDVWYVDHHNLLLDIRILVMTLFRVFQRQGINEAGQATARKFRG